MEWKGVLNFPDYEVSEDGRVRRTTDLHMPLGGISRPAGTELKPKRWNRHKYLLYRLHKNGNTRSVYAHRLVAETFLGLPPFPKAEVAHGDGNRLNNHVSNLRWATHLENIQDAVRHGTIGRKT